MSEQSQFKDDREKLKMALEGFHSGESSLEQDASETFRHEIQQAEVLPPTKTLTAQSESIKPDSVKDLQLARESTPGAKHTDLLPIVALSTPTSNDKFSALGPLKATRAALDLLNGTTTPTGPGDSKPQVDDDERSKSRTTKTLAPLNGTFEKPAPSLSPAAPIGLMNLPLTTGSAEHQSSKAPKLGSAPVDSSTMAIQMPSILSSPKPAPGTFTDNAKPSNASGDSLKNLSREPYSMPPVPNLPAKHLDPSAEKPAARVPEGIRNASGSREQDALPTNTMQTGAAPLKAIIPEPRSTTQDGTDSRARMQGTIAPVDSRIGMQQSNSQLETRSAAQQLSSPSESRVSVQQSSSPSESRVSVQQSSSPSESRASGQQSSSPSESRVSVQQSSSPSESRASVQQSSSPSESRASVQQSSSLSESRASVQSVNPQVEVRSDARQANQVGRSATDSSTAVPTNTAQQEARSILSEAQSAKSENSSSQFRRDLREVDQIKLISLPVKMPEPTKISEEIVRAHTPPRELAFGINNNNGARPDEIRRHFVYQDEVRTEISGSPKTPVSIRDVATIKEVLAPGEKSPISTSELRPINKIEERGPLPPASTAVRDGLVTDREALREPSLKPSRSAQETVKWDEIKITKSTIADGNGNETSNDAFFPWFFLTPRNPNAADAKKSEKSDSTRKAGRTAAHSMRRTSYIVQDGDTIESVAIRQLRDVRFAGLLITVNRGIIRFVECSGRMEPQLRPLQMIWLPNEAERTNYAKAIFTNRSSHPAPDTNVSEQEKCETNKSVRLPEVTIMHALDTVLRGIRLSGGRQPVSLKHLEATLAPASKKESFAREVNAIINRLTECARIITKDDTEESFNCELQLLKDGNWNTVICYEYKRGAGRRYSCYNDGFRRPFTMDLPVTVVREMAKEDFKRNWSTYCSDFEFSQHRAS